jgi:hypothetical protein
MTTQMTQRSIPASIRDNPAGSIVQPIPVQPPQHISTTSPVPKLRDVLNDRVNPDCCFSKINFLKFLVDKHCIENYEFFSELSSIIDNYQVFKRYNSTSEWFCIYNQYIENETINLPASLVLELSKKQLPSLAKLQKIEKIILNYLLASYYEFLTATKAENSRSTSFSSTATNTQSPDSTSVFSSLCEKSTLDTINKLNHGVLDNLNKSQNTEMQERRHYHESLAESNDNHYHDDDYEFDDDGNNGSYDDDEIEIQTETIKSYSMKGTARTISAKAMEQVESQVGSMSLSESPKTLNRDDPNIIMDSRRGNGVHNEFMDSSSSSFSTGATVSDKLDCPTMTSLHAPPHSAATVDLTSTSTSTTTTTTTTTSAKVIPATDSTSTSRTTKEPKSWSNFAKKLSWKRRSNADSLS